MLNNNIQDALQCFGIYTIYAKYNNSIYIGSTRKSFYTRFYAHKKSLEKNNHGNSRLQHIYNKYGLDALVFSPLDIFSEQDLEFIYEIEQDWLDYFRNDLNFGVLNLSNVVSVDYVDPDRSEKLRVANTKYVYSNLVDPDNNVHNNITNLRAFAKYHNLNVGSLRYLVKNKRKAYNGWHLLGNEDFRKTPIYSFVSPEGIIISDIHSLKDFCATYSLQEPKMCNVWKGKRKSHKGWTKDYTFGEKFRSKRY